MDAYSKYMNIYNQVKTSGKLNKHENGWLLGDAEMIVDDGGMTRKIKHGDFRAIMNYDDSIEYQDGDESNLDSILSQLELI